MNEKLESEVMISDKGVNIDLLTMNAGNILPNPYKGKNAISAPASILFHTFKFSFWNSPRHPINIPNKNKAAVWNTRP